LAQQYKKQHIVPQSYLKRFAIKRKNRYQIGTRVIDKQGHVKLFRSSVSDVGYINNYYDTPCHEDNKYWEHYFEKNFEYLFGDVLDKIIAKITLSATDVCILSQDDKAVLAKMIMSQTVRVPSFLDEQIEKANKIVEDTKIEILEVYPNLEIEKQELVKSMILDSETRKDLVLDVTFNEERFEKFCNILEQKICIVYFNSISKDMPYLTCDNPVLYLDIKGNSKRLTQLGLQNNKTVIFYPLSPSILLGFYSHEIWFDYLSEFDGKVVAVNDMRFIGKVNYELMMQSFVHVFIPEPFFSFVLGGGNIENK